MIGSTDRARRRGFAGNAVRVAIRAKASPRSRGAGSHQDREEQRVPRHAAPERTAETVEPPDGAGQELVEEDRRREGTRLVAHGARQHREDRPEHEHGHERDDQTDRAREEGVALHEAACCETVAEEHEACEAEQEGPHSEAGLPGTRSAEEAREPRPRPPAVVDRESLERDPGETTRAGQHEQRRDAGVLPWPSPRQEWQEQGQGDREKPRAAVAKSLEQGRRAACIRIAPDPAHVEPAVTWERIPGENGEGQPGDAQPAGSRPGHAGRQRAAAVKTATPARRSGSRLASGSRAVLTSGAP